MIPITDVTTGQYKARWYIGTGQSDEDRRAILRNHPDWDGGPWLIGIIYVVRDCAAHKHLPGRVYCPRLGAVCYMVRDFELLEGPLP